MKLTKITLNPSGDGYYILFVDGVIFSKGDDYHNKMNDRIDGILDFLRFLKMEFSFEHIKLDVKNENKSHCDYDYQPDLDENLDKYLKRMKRNFRINI